MNKSIARFLRQLSRKKRLNKADLLETPLCRCLSVFDLLLIGIGHMVGSGIYVITGTVARNISGPGIILSFLIAGVAAALAALCYAEFGARVPKAGSSYTYTYVTMGEFLAFLIGWSMILENLIGASSVAKAWSGYLDSMFHGAIRNGTMEYVGTIHVAWLSEYLDFVALLMVIISSVVVAVGVRTSTTFNNVLVVVNVVILLIIIAMGFHLGDLDNWTSAEHGGFLPFGMAGVVAGAGACFYSYIGFEGIAIAGEEAKNPSKSIPVATGLAVIVASLLYIGASASLTFMLPYNLLDITAPFPEAFGYHHVIWAKYVVSAGALAGMSTALLNSVYCLPRSIYSMASDGLLFRFMASVHPRTQTPLASIVICGLVSGASAFLVDIDVLVELMSIGTLLGFTIVSANVLVLRYQSVSESEFELSIDEADCKTSCAKQNDIHYSDTPCAEKEDTREFTTTGAEHEDNHSSNIAHAKEGTKPDLIPSSPVPSLPSSDQMSIKSDTLLNIGRIKKPFRHLPVLGTLPPGYACNISVASLAFFIIVFCLIVLRATQYLTNAAWWAILVLVLSCIGIFASVLVLCLHEQNTYFVTFQVSLGQSIELQFNPIFSCLLS